MFTILCALCLAVIVPVALQQNWLVTGIIGGFALLSFALMLLFKQSQEQQEEQKEEKEPEADFISPKNPKK